MILLCMKKILIITMVCLLALSMSAQRCAVLKFRAGAGISIADVDGISAIFITYFRPGGYTLVERTQIDKVIGEQGFQLSRMTEDEMVRVGQILNVSLVVVGDVNVVMGQYNVDVRAINVESGIITAVEGATFNTASYRSNMQSLAQNLANKVAITSNYTISTHSQNSLQQDNEPYIIYDYLKIFPKDLGTFQMQPKQVITRLNQSMQYGYGTWRLPTNEELSLMRANKLVGSGKYMTQDNQQGIVRLVTDKEKGEKMPPIPEGYIDLGLSSKTLWKNKNEDIKHVTYEQAIAKFGSDLPTKEQWEELQNSCMWTWAGSGYQVVGPNGSSIFLPLLGFQSCNGSISYEGVIGYYWSSTSYDSNNAWYLFIDSHSKNTNYNNRCCGLSIRLVQ